MTLPNSSDAHERELNTVITAYVESYAAYAQGFMRVVESAASRADGILAEVEFRVDADPASLWWQADMVTNPVEFDDDELVWRLWSAALETMPPPLATRRASKPKNSRPSSSGQTPQ